ncbi:MAG: LamB/YcsF family protein [Leucobacter sp.]
MLPSTARSIDLNSDLGEHSGGAAEVTDELMLQMVTSANVACGFHAGSVLTMLQTCQIAKSRSVAIGAHVSYFDRAGFGRTPMNPSDEDLMSSVVYQIGALQAVARSVGAEVRYVKPHGALYNTIAEDERQSGVVIAAMRSVAPELSLVCLAGSSLVDQVRAAGLHAVPEAFADRAYTSAGSLMPRSEPGAVLSDATEVANRMVSLVQNGTILAADGSLIRLDAASICVHGDSPGAVQMARAVREKLLGAGVGLAPFATSAS